MSNKNGFEIERKFLIQYPDTALLRKMDNCTVMEIEQSYLRNGGRIRKICQDNKTYYIKTVKKHITDIKREEREWEISEAEYIEGLKEKAQNTSTIKKTRYAIPKYGFVYEIDVFDFWKDKAFVEVELENENQEFPIPEFVSVIKEVTEDKRYRNSSLAVNHNF
ncbi:MAG: hypothetical protein U0L72_00410 [Acutalibacteraceae bacterium]|nr:hypothetical protein [Acutalibacteraceae bacterium]